MLNYDQVEDVQHAVQLAINAASESKALLEKCPPRFNQDAEIKSWLQWMKKLQEANAVLERMLVAAEAKFPGTETITFVGDWELSDPTF